MFVPVLLALGFMFVFVLVGSNTCIQQPLSLNCGVCKWIQLSRAQSLYVDSCLVISAVSCCPVTYIMSGLLECLSRPSLTSKVTQTVMQLTLEISLNSTVETNSY